MENDEKEKKIREECYDIYEKFKTCSISAQNNEKIGNQQILNICKVLFFLKKNRE